MLKPNHVFKIINTQGNNENKNDIKCTTKSI